MNPRMKMRGYGGAAILVLTGTVAWLMVQVPTLQDDAKSSSATANQALTEVAEVKAQVSANASALAEANAKLVALGKAPVPVPPPKPSSPPAQLDEFTDEEAAAVRVIVADQISRQKVQITRAEITQIARVAATLVPKPKDGKSVTVEQLKPLIAVAIATYCANDRCVGKSGDDGKNGDNGIDGQDAPKVTDEQLRPLIAASFVNYCGQDSNPCEGKVGPQGPIGETGPQGVGIADTDCVGEGAESYWRIHYTNGTEGRSQGPCRISMPPETTPAKKTGN